MTVIRLSSTIRPTAFREVYRRRTGRGMRPANALGHVAGKLSVVLYSMRRDMTPYDESQHRQQLGMPQPEHASGSALGVSTDLIDIADAVHEPTEIDVRGRATRVGQAARALSVNDGGQYSRVALVGALKIGIKRT
jgi:superfamily II DNA or RNA helicase